jgi:ribosome-associated protein
MSTLNFNKILDEAVFQATLSSGKGGQHVNKVSTRIVLLLDVAGSAALSEQQKEKIIKKLKGKISSAGILQIASQDQRSQLLNKKTAIKKLYELLIYALQENKKRIPTQVSRSSVIKRLKEKKRKGEIKSLRKKDSRKDFD